MLLFRFILSYNIWIFVSLVTLLLFRLCCVFNVVFNKFISFLFVYLFSNISCYNHIMYVICDQYISFSLEKYNKLIPIFL